VMSSSWFRIFGTTFTSRDRINKEQE